MIDLKELRRTAEKLVENQDYKGWSNKEYRHATRPYVLLELLDRLEKAEIDRDRFKVGWERSHKAYVRALSE